MRFRVLALAVLVMFAFGFDFGIGGSNKIFKHLDTAATVLSESIKASRPISDSEEYYIGRSVAAKIFSSYELLETPALLKYINLVGHGIVLHSDKPVTYNGYHFALLDSGEINAFACPGGTIFITMGMIAELESEEELAGVLAHEIAHINRRHGISAIKKSRWTEALTVIGTKAARNYGSKEVGHLTNIFEGTIDDVFNTLVVKGYGRKQEVEADSEAMKYMARAGYDPAALLSFLEKLRKKQNSSKGGMLSTHPKTGSRIKKARKNLPGVEVEPDFTSIRTARFSSALSK